MAVTRIDTVVVGAGQAGIAMSEHLTAQGIDHVVLERDRIAEKWRSARWDSLVANGPAWHDCFPGMGFDAHGGDDFVPKEEVADYFMAYAAKINAPVQTGVEVRAATRNPEGGFTVETSQGTWHANHIVAATGPFQTPRMPDMIPPEAGLMQIHSADYRNPEQLPQGKVMVVGAGSSGAQIAEELQEAGREVILSVSAHDRPPRRYRGRDNVWWLGVLGKWELPTPAPGTEHVTFAVSGKQGGRTVDFRRLAAGGMVLTGRVERYADGVIHFADDLQANIAHGDANYASVLAEADAYVARHGLDLPEDPEARHSWPDPACLTTPVRQMDVQHEGLSAIIWATGYTNDFSWLKVDAFDDTGRPAHTRGISTEPGVYFLGLPWLSRRGSSFIWGVWHDAKFLADQIAIQHHYRAYRPADAAP